MNFLKRRAWHGLLALICILASIVSFLPLPLAEGKANAAAGPDLTIDSITWSPENPALGNDTEFTVAFTNRGDTASAACHLGFFMDSNFTDYASIPSIPAGESTTAIFTWKATGGDHIVKAIIDNEETVSEPDENNNEKSYAFSVLAADLVVESITWSPEQPSSGDRLIFTVKIKNTGNKAASVSWVELFIDGVTRGQHEGVYLDPGSTFTNDFVWVAQPGQHLLQATADVLDQVKESSEVNNDTTKIYCTTPPDLTIDSITYSPANRTETGNVTMRIIVKNQGKGESYGSWVDYYIDDKLQITSYVPALEPGEKSTGNYTWIPGPEGHVFKAVIDSKDIIFETDESNNSQSVALPSLGLPDLAIIGVTWTPSAPVINSRMTFTVTVKNSGDRTVEKTNLYLNITGGNRLTQTLGPIDPGQTITVNFPWITNVLEMNVRASIDEENWIEESNEFNNEKIVSVMPSKPVPTCDLTVESITFTPETPEPGDYVTIKTTVINLGPGTAAASNIACYVDGVLLGFIYFNDLSSGSSTTREILWKATTGQHTVRAVIDFNDEVLETNEANNEKTASVLTVSPDLAIEDIEWYPVDPMEGDTVQFKVTVKNQGDLVSGPCYITYLINGAPQGTHYLDKLEAGASAIRNFSWTMQGTSMVFTAALDRANSIAESNETNNDRSVSIPAPDISIVSITCSDDYPIADTPLTFTVNIQNTGRSKAPSVKVKAFADNTAFGMSDSSDISAAFSVQSVFTWIAVPGKHTIRIVADEENAVIENDKADNSKEIIIFVPLPSGNQDVSASSNTTEGTGDPADTTSNATDSANMTEEDLIAMFSDIGDSTDNQTADISANISATPVKPSGGIKDILMNKWLLIGVAGAGLGAIAVLFILRKRAGKPKQEKQPKAPKAPKAEKPPKVKEEKKAKPAAKPVQAADTLSGKPAVLVPPPPKPTAKPGIAPPPIKPVVPPAVNTGAGQNLGATLIKQNPPQQPPAPPQPPKPV